jgi:hypothetical protein
MKLKRVLTLLTLMLFVIPSAHAQFPYTLLDTAENKEVLTPSMYNNEHNQHITKNDPDFINDLSNDDTEQRLTTDPSLARPTTLTGEIQGLRYRVGILDPNSTYWMDTFVGEGYGYANLAPNGGFEYWDNGITSAPNGWVLVGGTTVSQTIATNTGYTGDAWAVEVTSAGVNSNGIKYTFDNLKASTTYTVVVGAKVTAGDTAKASTTGGASNLSETTIQQSWVFSLNGTFTTDGTPAPVELTLGSDTSGDIVFFDNLMIVEGAMARAYGRHIPSVPITHPTYRNLVVESTSVTTITITADYVVVENPTTKHRIALQNISETTDITSSGIGGIDVGSEADITYYQYITYNPVTAAQDSFMSSSSTTPVLPSGYTYYKNISFCRNSTDIIEYKQINDRLMFDNPLDDTSILNNGIQGSWTDVSATASAGFNNICQLIYLSSYFEKSATATTQYAWIRPNGTSGSGKLIGVAPEHNDNTDVGADVSEIIMYLDSDSKFEYKTTGGVTGLDLYISVCILDL